MPAFTTPPCSAHQAVGTHAVNRTVIADAGHEVRIAAPRGLLGERSTPQVLALATSLASTVNLVLLLPALRRRLHGLELREMADRLH